MKGFGQPEVRVKRSQETRNYLILIDDFVVDSAALQSCAQSVRSWLKKCLADDPLPSGFTEQQGIEWLCRHRDGPVCKAKVWRVRGKTIVEGVRRGIASGEDFLVHTDDKKVTGYDGDGSVFAEAAEVDAAFFREWMNT
jgi:hypothetical protein